MMAAIPFTAALFAVLAASCGVGTDAVILKIFERSVFLEILGA